jgi:hypothetical protein
VPAETVRLTPFAAASAFALFSIDTKYGLEKVLRIRATLTFPPEPPELPVEAVLAVLLVLGDEAPPPEFEFELLEPHAAIARAPATASAAVVAPRRRAEPNSAPERFLDIRVLSLLPPNRGDSVQSQKATETTLSQIVQVTPSACQVQQVLNIPVYIRNVT